MTIMQGDEYAISFSVNLDGEPIDVSKVETIEFVVGDIVKRYPNIVYYDQNSQKFIYFITQKESFSFGQPQSVQCRVKFRTGEVVGRQLPSISIQKSLSKEVL